MAEASESLAVFLRQENTKYLTEDYLTRMREENLRRASGNESLCKKRKSLECAPELSKVDASSPSTEECNNQGTDTAGCRNMMTAYWREKICEWKYQVVDRFDLRREIVSIAMSHLDRYLSTCPTSVDKNFFQLLAMTCLYMAIKLNEYKHILIPGSKSTMESMLELSRGHFNLQEMELLEYDILQRLQWHVHPPTPQLFLKYYLYFLSLERHEVHDLAQFMIELSVLDYFFVSHKPSDVAKAAMIYAIEEHFPERFDEVMVWLVTNQLVDMDCPNLKACLGRLSELRGHEAVRSEAPGPCGGMSNQRTESPTSVTQNSAFAHHAANDSMDTDGDDYDDEL